MTQLQRILYVEDDPDIVAVARVALEVVGGFELEVCYSGEEALAKGPQFGPDLLLLDVMMPEMDGPTTLAALRKVPTTADVPAVFMTAKVQPNEVEALRRLGAVDVIAKPFDPMQLADQLLAIWEARDRSPK